MMDAVSRGDADDRDSDLVVYEAILETLTGPRVVWRGGSPSVDMSAYDRPFVPAVTPSAAGLVSRRG